MSIEWGVLETGYSLKPASIIKTELDEALKAGPLGESAGSEEDGSIPAASVAGQLVAIMTDGLSAQWENGEAAYAALSPGGATGDALDVVCSITGTLREGEDQSTVTATCTGTPATVLPTGRVATVEDAGTRFASLAQGTIAAATAWVALTDYVAGDVRTNASRIYICITDGTAAGSGGPTTTAEDITDGSAHWRYVGEGTGYVDVAFEAEDAGALAAASGTLNVIATPISGWQSVKNLLDADLGRSTEGSVALRARREAELSGGGAGTADSIRAAILEIDDVETCTVFYNDSDITDGNGLPPHSVEALVQGGEDADIAAALWDQVGAGIYTHGDETETVEDSQGVDQTVRFSRPDEVTIHVIANVLYDASTFPTDLDEGKALIKGAIVTAGDAYPVGLDVRASQLAGKVFNGPTSTDAGAVACPGILDVTSLLIRTSSPPIASTTIAIGVRERAVFDTARVTVNLTSGTP